MARTLDDYLESYLTIVLETLSEEGEDYDGSVSELVDDYKKYMGRNISSRFCSFLSEDEEIACLMRCAFFVWDSWDFLRLGALINFNWLLCITTKKIIAFSNGFFGLGIANKAVKIFTLNHINSVQLCGKKRIKLISGQTTHYFELFDQGIGWGDPSCLVDAYMVTLNTLLDSQSNNIPLPQQPPNSEDTLEQLERLSQLYQQGLLTEQEFQIQKEKILENR